MNLPEIFRVYLISQKSSPATVKNYLADINQFLNWLAQKTGIKYQIAGKSIFGLFTTETLEEYRQDEISTNTPLSTINRRLSSLRKFGQFGKQRGWILENPAEKIPNVTLSDTSEVKTSEVVLKSFRKHLEAGNISPLTIKNYLSDLRHFLSWLETT